MLLIVTKVRNVFIAQVDLQASYLYLATIYSVVNNVLTNIIKLNVRPVK